MHLFTDRLILEYLDKTAQPEDFLGVFQSNPDFIEASRSKAGKRSFDLADVEEYLQAETSRENSRCLAIRLRASGKVVGTALMVAPHPREPFPWIGLLLLDYAWQRHSLGAEAATAIEEQLAREGWAEVRLGVTQTNPGARRFWERQGYVVYGERLEDEQPRIWLMRKSLSTKASE